MKKIEALEYCKKCQNFRFRFDFKSHHKSKHNIGGYTCCDTCGLCLISDKLVRVEEGRIKIRINIPDSVIDSSDNKDFKTFKTFFKSFIEEHTHNSMSFRISSIPEPLLSCVDNYLMKQGRCMINEDDKECCFHMERMLEKWNKEQK